MSTKLRRARTARNNPYTKKRVLPATSRRKHRPKTAPVVPSSKLSLDPLSYPPWLTKTFLKKNTTTEEKKRYRKERRERSFRLRHIRRPRTAPATKKRTGLRRIRKRGLTATSSQLTTEKKHHHLFSLTLKDLRMRRHVPKLNVKLSHRTLSNAIRAGIPKRTIVRALEDGPHLDFTQSYSNGYENAETVLRFKSELGCSVQEKRISYGEIKHLGVSER